MMKDVILTALSKDELETLVAHQFDLAFQRNWVRPNTPTTSKVMSLTEVCNYTGLSRQTLYKKTSRAEIPHSKCGKKLFFDREKVDAWLLENQVATQAEIKKKATDYLSKSRNRQRM